MVLSFPTSLDALEVEATDVAWLERLSELVPGEELACVGIDDVSALEEIATLLEIEDVPILLDVIGWLPLGVTVPLVGTVDAEEAPD